MKRFTEDQWGKIRQAIENIDEPEPAEPVTTVTVWHDYRYPINRDKFFGGETSGIWWKGTYTFKGTPDISRIIAETLEQGALAIKVECTEEFIIANRGGGTFRLWHKEIDVRPYLWDIDGFGAWITSKGVQSYISDFDIESAITAWLEKKKEVDKLIDKLDASLPDNYGDSDVGENIAAGEDGKYYKLGVSSGGKPKRPATLDEIAEFYTCELAGEKVRAYEDSDGDIVTIFPDGYMSGVLYGCPNQARDFCALAHIPIMSWVDVQKLYDGEFRLPKGK